MGRFTQLSLLVTDLDRTLVGNDESLERLNQLLDRYRQTYGTKIVYATGRSRESYHELLTTQQLLVPDALIAGCWYRNLSRSDGNSRSGLDS